MTDRDRLLAGVQGWNLWLQDNPTVWPDLRGADLTGADLALANLRHAVLTGADLMGAVLRGADLRDAVLMGANLRGATLPDGRPWADYCADPLAGICQDATARVRAIAAWGKHSWGDCPMHAAHGWTSLGDVPEDTRIRVAAFVALFDAELLPKPEVRR